MAFLGSNIVRLVVGKAYTKYPPAKALEGVLKSHIMMDAKNSLGRKSSYLRDYFFGIAKLAENKNNSPSANLIKSYLV